MKEISTDDLRRAVLNGAHVVISEEQYLSKLDSFVGDGDHGATVARGFTAVIQQLDGLSGETNCAAILSLVGSTLAKTMGGAIGPIFGGIFLAASKALPEDSIMLQDYAAAMEAGLAYVKKIGGAHEGDRTLVDALSPYADTLSACAAAHATVAEALRTAAEAAMQGAENTKSMRAQKGRAKFLQEKSIGYQDAGATSFALVMKGISDFFNQTGR